MGAPHYLNGCPSESHLNEFGLHESTPNVIPWQWRVLLGREDPSVRPIIKHEGSPGCDVLGDTAWLHEPHQPPILTGSSSIWWTCPARAMRPCSCVAA